MTMNRQKTEFEEAGEEEKALTLAGEFFLFLRESKKWWLVPILLLLGLTGLLIALGSTGAAPFIYTLF
jgi:hypothetical protein